MADLQVGSYVKTASAIDTSGLGVSYQEMRQGGVISRDRNSVPPNELDSRYPSTSRHQSIGAIKKYLDSFASQEFPYSITCNSFAPGVRRNFLVTI